MNKVFAPQIDVIREIISVLTPHERATIKVYLSSFVEKGKESSIRTLQLFEKFLSIKDKKLTAQLLKEIKGKTKRNSFNHQIARLRRKIQNALLIDVNIDREGIYPVTIWANIEVRKNITLAQIFQKRKARKVAETMFRQVIEECKKYEFYEELLIALRCLMRHIVLNEGDKKLQGLLRQYRKYDRFKNAVLNAEVSYYKIISKTDFYFNNKVKGYHYREMMDQMSDDFKKTRSIQIGYFYYYIETQFYQSKQNYVSARRSLSSLQRLLVSGPAMNIPETKGGVQINLGENDLYIGKFERAYKTLQESLSNFDKGNFNYERACELMVYAKFYEGDYQATANLILQSIPDSDIGTNFHKGKQLYFLSATYFMLREYALTLRHLNMINPISVDKEGWNMGIRILQIMTLIECQEFDEASAKIDSLRKFFENGGKNQRAKMINQVLQALTYNGYDFQDVYKNLSGVFEMLDTNAGDLAWQIKSPEMVIFNQWFFNKAFNQTFIQKIASFQINSPKEFAEEEDQ